MAARVGVQLSVEVKSRIIAYHEEGMSPVNIERVLKDRHSVSVTRQGIRSLIVRHRDTGTVHRRPPTRANLKISELHMQFIDMWISSNPEMTAKELSQKLSAELGVSVTQQHAGELRRKLGWKAQDRQYCQMISAKNKRVRLEWCLSALRRNDDFRDVVFVDETTVEMCSTGKLFYHKATSSLDRLPSKAPKPKHSYKVHVWGGISYRGRTAICIFSGIMDSVIYQKILKDNLLPFVEAKFPDGYRLYQDNDSKHKNVSTRRWFEEVGVAPHVMVTPASSPDINPIEMIWAQMKHFLRKSVKPKKKDELISGIRQFWEQHLTVQRCKRTIDRIHRVIPSVVLNNGESTNY